MAERERALLTLYNKTGLSPATVRAFRSLVKWFYRHHGRDLPWRVTPDPYRVFVSEMMLQQTQVPRVAEKFPAFVKEFPSFAALADAPLDRVLRAWQGMGYNRRALSLKRAAEIVVGRFRGKLPASPEQLDELPGIGKATAASIAAFGFNSPTVFIETNIRSVFIHYFFAQRGKINDKEIVALVAKMIDRRNPRDWYNGLMDLGTWLKATHGNPSVRGAMHKRQSAFEGSMRQVRGAILRHVLKAGPLQEATLRMAIDTSSAMLSTVLGQLEAEGFIRRDGGIVSVVS